MFSADKKGGSKRMTASGSYEKNSSSSIAEESHLMGAEASRGSSNNKQKNSGAIEESIHESVMSNDGSSNSVSGSATLPPKTKKQQEL